MERERAEQGPADDSERLANYSRQVLRENGIDTTDPEIAEALAEIAQADPEESAQLIMDLMGNAGLEPDEAFAEVIGRGEGEVEEIKPNASQRIAAIVGVLLDESDVRAPSEIEAIANRSGHGALGTAADLLVQKGVCASTQEALLLIDPDGSLEAEVNAL